MANENITERRDSKAWSDPLVYLACGVLMAVILALDLMIPAGVAMAVPYVVVVLISLWASRNPATIWVGILCSALTLLALQYQPMSAEVWKIVLNRFLALLVIWTTVSIGLKRKKLEQARERAVQEREKALKDLRILRGMLPICASCKKIRDGQGDWRQLEAYLKVHSEAVFSHSLCPDCAKELYPELFVREMQP